MKTSLTREAAELKVVNKYQKLYAPLIDLVNALQLMEPGGTLVDDVVFSDTADDHKVRIAYTAHPIMLTIQTKERVFILRMVEGLHR